MRPLFLLVVLLGGVPVWAQTTVTVHVTDEANVPIAGAMVEPFVWQTKEATLPVVLTDATGTARISVPTNDQGKIAAGMLGIAANGFAFKSSGLGSKLIEIHLEKGATWSGQVTDEAGKPLAGAKVRVTGGHNGDDWENSVWLHGEKLLERYTVVSGVDGRFQMPDLPTKLGLSYGVELPGFAAAGGQNAMAGTEEVIKLKPGGAIHGRVLDVEGKPLPKIKLFAGLANRGEGGNDGTSDENGEFTIESLAPGEYRVVTYTSNEEFVLPRLNGLRVQASKTTEAPALRAIKGVEIRGIVRDAATKKPLAGGNALAEQDNETSSYDDSDKEGRFSLRVVPGTYRVYLSGVPEGYLRPETQQNVDATGAAPAELVFDLKKADKIAGTTVDESGKPIAAQLKVGWVGKIQSDADGKWEYTPTEGKSLNFVGGDDETGYFEVVSPEKIDLPARGNVTVKVRKKSWGTVTGRVVGGDGTPLEGVKVTASFYIPVGDESWTDGKSEAISDADGRFVLPKVRESRDMKVEGKKAGFAFQEGGKLAKDGANWNTSDLVLAALNRRIEGTTTPGAHVVAAGRETTADKEGKFAFEGLPQGELGVFAAQQGFGSAIARGAEPITIALRPQGVQGVDSALAEEIRTETRRDAVGKKFYAESALQGAGAATSFEDAIQKARVAAPKERDDFILRATAQWKKGDSLELLQSALDDIVNDDERTYGYLDAASKTGDADLARNALQIAEQTFKKPEKEKWWREMNLYRAAPVAERVEGEKAGSAALDRAIAFTLKNHGEKSARKNGYQTEVGRDDMMAMQADVVAQGSVALLQHLLTNIDPDSGYLIKALGDAIPVIGKTHGVDVALPLLEELAKKPTPPQEGELRYSAFDPQYSFGTAARGLIPLLGAQSPEKALQLAQRVQDKQHRGRALASAVRFQKGEAAANLWREVIKSANTEDTPRFAAAAWNVDPKLGAELFEIVRDKVESEMSQPYVYRNLWAPFAFYYARVEAAQARLILEKEWGRLNQKKAEGQDLQAIARAMSAIDGRRAWEMAKQIQDDKDSFWSLETRRKIAQYIETNEELRRDFPFDRWGATDTWDPGDKEW